MLVVQQREGPADVALHHRIQQIEAHRAVGQSQHAADVILADLLADVGEGLIQETQPVAYRAVGSARDEMKCGCVDARSFFFGYVGKMASQHFRFNAPEVEALAPAEHGDWNLSHLGGGEDEAHVVGRLFQGLEECVEGVLRQHVDFVDDVDLVASRNRAITHTLDELADVVDASAAGRIHFEYVDVAVFGYGKAGLALTAGLGRRAAGAVGADAVERPGDDARRRRLADAAHAGEDEGVGETARVEGIGQGAHHGLLADQFSEGRRPVLAGEDPIGLRLGARFIVRGGGRVGGFVLCHRAPGARLRTAEAADGKAIACEVGD